VKLPVSVSVPPEKVSVAPENVYRRGVAVAGVDVAGYARTEATMAARRARGWGRDRGANRLPRRVSFVNVYLLLAGDVCGLTTQDPCRIRLRARKYRGINVIDPAGRLRAGGATEGFAETVKKSDRQTKRSLSKY